MSFTGRVIGTSFCIGSKYDILYRQEKAVLTVCLYGSAKYIKAVCLEFYSRDGSLTGIAKGNMGDDNTLLYRLQNTVDIIYQCIRLNGPSDLYHKQSPSLFIL